MGWFYVALAAGFEVLGVIGLKSFSQHKSLKNGAPFFGGFGLSFVFLYLSFMHLQVSVAYAVWIGIGTAAAVLINMLFFGESKSKGRVISLVIIVIGVTGLKAVS
ncbi:paired small multidrug resistance pump [Alkalihalobacillus xiaoxiensis]|uniref:Paired small multidrug resistance pump n=1 Tax=Shouchella xiaoxiensis TaxID=766895 RepID=A0ABS2SYD5_9BACI|nr:multidrug efflux SMR transporter [Shouchella xiaoxiensis]MBM7839247.1 paired small multidrug resistance pump [Shouchella xiaoxiensis]